MKSLSVSQLIFELRQKGYDVKYRRRSDRGILITSINGVRFSGAHGNTEARSIIGTTLSSGRKEQLEMASSHRQAIKEGRAKSTKNFNPDKEIERLQRKVNRLRRKNNIAGGGIATKSKIRYNLEKYGKEEVINKLREQERYASGIAYTENVEQIAQRFDNLASLSDGDDKIAFEECAEFIRSHASKIKEEWINSIYYDIIQGIDNGKITPRQALSNLKTLINQ